MIKTTTKNERKRARYVRIAILYIYIPRPKKIKSGEYRMKISLRELCWVSERWHISKIFNLNSSSWHSLLHFILWIFEPRMRDFNGVYIHCPYKTNVIQWNALKKKKICFFFLIYMLNESKLDDSNITTNFFWNICVYIKLQWNYNQPT